MSIAQAAQFFGTYLSAPLECFSALPQSGSARANYVAEAEGKRYIVTTNENVAENEAFLYFSEVFSHLGLNTPYIYKVSQDRKMYIQTYLGKQTLSEIIQTEGESDRVKALVKQTLYQLYTLQENTQGKIDYTKTFEYERYDEIPILHDLFYFKFMFVDVLEVPYHKTTLIKEFYALVEIIQRLSPKGLMIRDFQSRNIMVNDADEVFFIDYQSAMYGALMYDVVSFLYQAKANFSPLFREEMLAYYYSLWQDPEAERHLKESVQPLLLIRALQVLGAYGFRGLIQKKPHFVQSIAQGVENAYAIASEWSVMDSLPELKSVIEKIKHQTIVGRK